MRSIGVVGAVLLLAFAGAGCGGSNDSGGDAAAIETAATDTSTSTDGASTDTTADDTTSTDTTSTETSGGLAGLSEDCKDLVEASQKFGAAMASSASGSDADLGTTAEAYKAFAASAPDDLKDDFTVLADVMAKYADALGDIDLQPGDVPTAGQIAELTKLGQALSTQEVQNASAAIATWTTENCN